MQADHHSACNLFSRLTTLAVEDSSRRIENFCTESLACLLLNSKDFQTRFLRLLGHAGSIDGFEYHTQEFCPTHERPGRNRTRNYFDLVAVSKIQRQVFIVEIKAFTGFPLSQLPKYAKAAARKYPRFRVHLVTISRHAEKPVESETHVRWTELAAALRQNPASSLGRQVREQFVQFLELKGLAGMKLKPIPPAVVNQWNNVASYQHQLTEILASLLADDAMKRIFGRRRSKEPQHDFDSINNRSWMGFYSPSLKHVKYIYFGIAVDAQAPPVLWVEVYLEMPPHWKSLPRAEQLPTELRNAYRAAKKFHKKGTDNWANNGEQNDRTTMLVFVRPIDKRVDSLAISNWLKETVLSAAGFAKRWQKGRLNGPE